MKIVYAFAIGTESHDLKWP